MKPWTLPLAVSATVLLAGCFEIGSETAGTGGPSIETGARTTPGMAAWTATWSSSEIARVLDAEDRRLAADAAFQALETGAAGVTREWRNADNGHHGSVTPGAPYSVNQYTCRDRADVIVVETRQDTRRGTACRQPDGSWRPIF